ncbi:restriction endonuclease subunit S [Mycobacterium sp. 155]|uniref:restriction endonuclease subunit S n=1 Tax=Mycobacterium sp. 155 TaxID=1157943 RepID=UPI0018DEDC5C|nr:restriction endonuclease subunit S [Mycobacterium sp. 155]
MDPRQEPDTANLPRYLIAHVGDLVVNPMWLIGGGVGVSTLDGAVSPDYRVFRSRTTIQPRFLHYLLRSQPYLDQYLLYTRAQTTFDRRVQQGDLDNLPLPIPPINEQRAIADYLDCETARIDTLIEEQQGLIELLQERRAAAVQRAVSGSLEEEAKHLSRSRWWVELPAAWQVVQLRRVLNFVADGPHFSPNYVDDGYMFISARNIKVDRWALEDAKFVSAEDFASFSLRVVPERGDVLYTKGGTTGIARVVDLDFPFQVWVHVAVLKVRRELVDPYFLAYALNSGPCYEQSQMYTRGATNNDLGLTRMVNIELPLPPLEEQRRIVAYLDEQTAKIDALIAETETFIDLSRERRSALITAAVTGQIDVREVA